MSKKEIIKTLDIASFISVIVATILVLIFEFTGEYLVMKYSIIMYDVTFLTLVVVLAFRVHNVFLNQTQKETESKQVEVSETVEEEKTEDIVEVENKSKQEKTKAIVWLVLASIAFVFTTVLMVLY